jgi:hypothetical protein
LGGTLLAKSASGAFLNDYNDFYATLTPEGEVVNTEHFPFAMQFFPD